MLAALHARDAEVHDFDIACRRQHEIGRLQIAMDDTRRVRILKRVEHLRAERERPRNGHRAALDQLLEGLAFEKLHHHQEIVTVPRELVNGADPPVIELRERQSLRVGTVQRRPDR